MRIAGEDGGAEARGGGRVGGAGGEEGGEGEARYADGDGVAEVAGLQGWGQVSAAVDGADEPGGGGGEGGGAGLQDALPDEGAEDVVGGGSGTGTGTGVRGALFEGRERGGGEVVLLPRRWDRDSGAEECRVTAGEGGRAPQVGVVEGLLAGEQAGDLLAGGEVACGEVGGGEGLASHGSREELDDLPEPVHVACVVVVGETEDEAVLDDVGLDDEDGGVFLAEVGVWEAFLGCEDVLWEYVDCSFGLDDLVETVA